MKREQIIAALLALICHAVLLFGIQLETLPVPRPISNEAVDVNLVAAAPSPEPPANVESVEPPPRTPAVPPEPKAEPIQPPEPNKPPEPDKPPEPEPIPRRDQEEPKPAPPRPPSKPQHSQFPVSKRSIPAAQEGTSGASPVPAPGKSNGTGTGNTAVRVRSNPRPSYPAEARRLRQQGRVILSVQVNADGRATSVSVMRGSGFPLLDAAAVQAVEHWTFEPARLAGLAVSSRAEVPVVFSLAQ